MSAKKGRPRKTDSPVRFTEGDSPWSFLCFGCRKRHQTGVYVAAHMHETLIHTCECGQQHQLRNGWVRAYKPRKK